MRAMDQSGQPLTIPALAKELVSAGILKEQEKKKEQVKTLAELKEVQCESTHCVEEELLFLILKKRGVITDEPSEALFRNLAKHIPSAQIVELYAENSE